MLSIEGNDVCVNKVLMDLGAVHKSYINIDVVNKYRDKVSHNIKKVNGWVKLGDNMTTKQITETIELQLTMDSAEGISQTATVDMVVWEMPGTDIILGLPDLVDKYLDVFIGALQEEKSARLELGEAVGTAAELGKLLQPVPELIEPWSCGKEEVSPEELDTPEPCAFTDAMYYLTKPHEEVLQDYMDMLPSHVNEEWQQTSDIMKRMKSVRYIQAFVPKEWVGLEGFEPLEFEFAEDMPAVHKCPFRPISQHIWHDTKNEIDRMNTYMYTDSDSAIASPMVVAPKATAPFIRMCGDYRWINKYIKVGNFYIPHVMKELCKAAGFKYFIDIDLTNAFHQIILGLKTSKNLSVATPWGLKRPKFLPEGVAPASGILQRMVTSIFEDYTEWCICLHDNMLVLCTDVQDGLAKLDKIIDRCIERRVVLKLAKSWIGFQEVKFFGYKVTPGKYELDEERKQGVLASPMPTSTKQMQRFLGVAVFFNEFIPNFAGETARLYDMIKTSFNWDKKTWTTDYEAEFERVKQVLAGSVAKYFPD